VESYVNLGIIYFQAGRWDEAFGVFQDGLRYDPRSPEANYNLGLLWERRGDAERAKLHYERFLTAAGVQHQELAARVRDHLRDYDKRRSKS
jgi:tetratricopeptide (TPR) repeat protein